MEYTIEQLRDSHDLDLQVWNSKEIKTWVKWNFDCTDYTANEVSYDLI